MDLPNMTLCPEGKLTTKKSLLHAVRCSVFPTCKFKAIDPRECATPAKLAKVASAGRSCGTSVKSHGRTLMEQIS